MFYVGIDLHKKTITVCVVNQERSVLKSRTLHCCAPEKIVAFFKELGTFQAVVEATASYEWLWQLLEPYAERLVLAHPKKLRIIAESTRKNDRLDAKALAEFLALDMIPEAYRPTPRQRQHRALVRQRQFIRKRITGLKNKIRHLVSNYNGDCPDLFEAEGQEYLKKLALGPADRFVVEQLLSSWHHHEEQLQAMDKALKTFAKKAPAKEKEARQVLQSIPGVGSVTVDVVVSELGEVRRFRSAKRVTAYAGLAPGQRESGGKRKELSISKEGSTLLRWALVEAAWRLVRLSRYWQGNFERLRHRAGKKKAIVAIARRLLGVMVALLRTGQCYRPVA
ncbi:MAG TPA: IS110 family transposase [Candidatus Dormibacteraeota bacterium]|nr:IS110 family transposase [Candidatus Dormibacteraeota bacterium]